jgi:AraC-like DNA-binding protein
MQILPSKELLPYIKHYLFLESPGNNIKKMRLFTDGNTGIVFCLNERIFSIESSGFLPHSFIYGQISKFKDLYLMNEATFIIVVFQPDGLYKLLGISAHELKEKIISAGDIFGSNGLMLHNKLIILHNLEDRLNALNRFFYESITKHTIRNQGLISASLKYITTHKGAVTLLQLIKHTGYTERHIERAFSESIGISPKKFGSIVRLHSFLKLLKNKSSQNYLTTMCYDSGYFDQSHLIREFRKYTGITPNEYLNDTSRLAINFMEFNSADNSMSGLYNFS